MKAGELLSVLLLLFFFFFKFPSLLFFHVFFPHWVARSSKNIQQIVIQILTFLLAPSRAPTSFTVTLDSSTSVQASWQLPTVAFQAITGFRLLYRKFSFVEDPLTVITIESNSTLTYEVTGLGIFTKYEFQVLAIVNMSDGPSSAVKTVRTNAEGNYSLWSYF